jgi:hypothetical protein
LRGERQERPARARAARGEREERPARAGAARGEREERPARARAARGEREEVGPLCRESPRRAEYALVGRAGGAGAVRRGG